MSAWLPCSIGKLQIKKSRIDFFVRDGNAEKLKEKEMLGLYPPLFRVSVGVSGSAEEGTPRFGFEGATEPLEIRIHYIRPIVGGIYAQCIVLSEQFCNSTYCMYMYVVFPRYRTCFNQLIS